VLCERKILWRSEGGLGFRRACKNARLQRIFHCVNSAFSSLLTLRCSPQLKAARAQTEWHTNEQAMLHFTVALKHRTGGKKGGAHAPAAKFAARLTGSA
jgi:hypothetical protein